MSCSVADREALLGRLRREVTKLEKGQLQEERPVSTGSEGLDRLLPAGGLRRGTLVEYLSVSAGGGAATLSLAAAGVACRDGRPLVVVEAAGRGSRRAGSFVNTGSAGAAPSQNYFYPPAAAAWGLDLASLLVLRAAHEADALWAFDQALRCPGVGAVWGLWDRLEVRDFRRLQLAAETGGTLGLLIRPARLRGQPTWADVQFRISPRPQTESPKPVTAQSRSLSRQRSQDLGPWTLDFGFPTWRISVEVVRCRGGASGQKVILELDETTGAWREAFDEPTHSLPVLAELADSTPARRA